MLRTNVSVGVLIGSMLLTAVGADEPGTKEKKATASPTEISSRFERLKGLAGDWQIAGPNDKAKRGKIAVRYRLSAGGSAVVETLFPGEDKEMVSVYHRDGDQLTMTHYCCAGNQPRMRASARGGQDELVFEFAGGSNLDPAQDMYMHGLLIRFVDSDRLHTEWEYYRGGKAAGKHQFDLIRKK